MITSVVVLKVVRSFFHPRVPVEIMVGFFDETGKPVGSQLLAAELLPPHISEGDSLELAIKTNPSQVLETSLTHQM
jgi:hypothetical protein